MYSPIHWLPTLCQVIYSHFAYPPTLMVCAAHSCISVPLLRKRISITSVLINKVILKICGVSFQTPCLYDLMHSELRLVAVIWSSWCLYLPPLSHTRGIGSAHPKSQHSRHFEVFFKLHTNLFPHTYVGYVHLTTARKTKNLTACQPGSSLKMKWSC
jgi:hypothetical protein